MKIPCEIDNVKTLKNGMKITFAIDDENVKEALKNIYNFIDRSLIIDLAVNEKEELEKMNMITALQRKKIYALFRDISNQLGTNEEYAKENLKTKFIKEKEYEPFSLSNVDKNIASDFIAFLVEFAFEYGVELKEHPKEIINNIDVYIEICMRKKMCCICGRESEKHHLEGSRIGMGNNRNKVDETNRRKIPLCRVHHSELHNMSEYDFLEKYHLENVNKGGE